jgi:predicted transcriptional regulator
MKHGNKIEPQTKFGKWLLDKMIEVDRSCTDVAKELGTTRQTVWNHITGVSSPSFVWVIAYCWLFNQTENINEIWYMIMEEAQ